MKLKTLASLAAIAALTAACGGGGGAAAGMGGGGGGGGGGGLPVVEPDPPVDRAVDYAALADRTGTSALGGAILRAGTSVDSTSGTITHSTQTFTASGVSGAGSLADSSDFDLPSFLFARDIGIDTQTVAIVGVATDPADMRSSGSAAFTGNFAGQLVDPSSITGTVLNWDADIQVNFAGGGDVDMTFSGGGSDLIDTIRVRNATISGNGFAGGTFSTANNGVTNNVTGTGVDLNGTFFAYDDVLLLPAEVGGAIQSRDADTIISGVFLTRVQP